MTLVSSIITVIAFHEEIGGDAREMQCLETKYLML